jgi:hypothetical protein
MWLSTRLFSRQLCTNSCKDEDILKLLNKPLKVLYSKIHPDRFANHPEIATKNQQTLQSLNAFVDMLTHIKEQQQHWTTNKRPCLETCHLEFYIPCTIHSEDQGTKTPGSLHKQQPEHVEAANVQKISVPVVYDASQCDSLHLLGSFVQLFRSCNIETPQQLVRWTKSSSLLERDTKEGHLSLGQLLQRDVAGKAYELRIRNKRHSTDGMMLKVAYECRVLRSSLMRAYSIKIDIKYDVSPRMAVEGLKRLADCIQRVIVPRGISIRGGVIELDGGSQVEQDSLGILHLGLCARLTRWEEALESDSFISSCWEASRMKEMFLEMENELAQAWSVRFVCGDAWVEEAPREYLKLLSSHLESWRENKVQVLDEYTSRLCKEYVSIMFRKVVRFEEEPDWGILSVPRDEKVEDILRYLQERGTSLAQSARKKQREVAQIEAVRKSLRLERLKRDEKVVDSIQFRKCCDRLASSCSVLKPILQGLSVVVSDHFKVTENGEVYLPFDWKW